MKAKLVAILLLTVIVLWPPPQTQSQQSTQSIKYFGYINALSDTDLSRVRSYTNFTYVDGEYGQSITATLNRTKSYGLLAIVDLGKVLWCPQSTIPGTCPISSGWHLCGQQAGETSYVTRWNQWKSQNASVLNSSYVLAFSVIGEPTWLGIPTTDVESAVALVKQSFPGIPTLVAEAHFTISQPNFRVPVNADWVGSVAYYIHPNLDSGYKDSVTLLKQKKQSWQKMAYTLDAFYGPPHAPIAASAADMDTIAQEWYTIASKDPEAVVLAPFLWANLSCEGAIGSTSFPQNVLKKHQAIGAAILAGKVPKYQGVFESVSCFSVKGWAWDASQPNTPISVDIYEGSQKLATVRANQFRQDLLNGGVGNGQHGFTFNLPTSLRDGLVHWITIKYSGLEDQLNSGSRTIICGTCGPASIAWIEPSEFTWGPPNTMTVAGYAQPGCGGVQLVWRDVSINGPWNTVSWQPAPSSDGTWSNTIPSSNRCHTYEAYVNYAGYQSPPFTYTGVNTSYCKEKTRVIWIQPYSGGVGSPGNLIVAGSAEGAPAGTQVYMRYRDVTANSGWMWRNYAPVPDANGIWLNEIPNANYSHVYEVEVTYDVVTSSVCSYAGQNSISWCPVP